MITAFAHVCFVVKDLAASEAFYRDKLGLRVAFEFLDYNGERFGLYIHVGGRSFIELFKGTLASQAEGQTYQHLCLEVDDIHQTVAELRSNGIESTDVQMGSDQSYQSWLSDPDGNRIELHQYTDDSKQAPWVR